jgi:hypothetical protein
MVLFCWSAFLLVLVPFSAGMVLSGKGAFLLGWCLQPVCTPFLPAAPGLWFPFKILCQKMNRKERAGKPFPTFMKEKKTTQIPNRFYDTLHTCFLPCYCFFLLLYLPFFLFKPGQTHFILGVQKGVGRNKTSLKFGV